MGRPNDRHIKMFNIRASEFNSSEKVQKWKRRKFGHSEVDADFLWCVYSLTNTNTELNIIEHQDHGEKENEYNDNDIDPQYSRFLKALTGNGRSYKLQISQNGETPCFLEYEVLDGYEPPTDISPSLENGLSLTPKEVSRKNNINESARPCYQLVLDGCDPSEYGKFGYEGKQLKYEETGTSSDSEILMWENAKDCSEVNNKQAEPAEKDSSLKGKLMVILKKPYDQEEYEELLQYAEQKKPICRLLDLRDRSISSALNGVTKSVLDDVPAVRRRLEAARNDRPRALNLLRMLRFWLEYLPNKDSFRPWADEDCLSVRPSSRT